MNKKKEETIATFQRWIRNFEEYLSEKNNHSDSVKRFCKTMIPILNDAIEIMLTDEHLLSIKCSPDIICKQNDSDCLWCRQECEDRLIIWS